MRKLLFLSFAVLFIYSCTNPEVNFPDEKKETKTDKKTIPYKIPTVLAYSENSSPVIFYYLISLARANGAEDSYLIPVKDNKQRIIKTIDKLTQFYGEKPILIGVKISIKDYYEEIQDKVKKVVLIEPKDDLIESENLIIFSTQAKDIKTESKKDEIKVNEKKTDPKPDLTIPKEIESDKMKEMLSKIPEESKIFLQKIYLENTQTKKYVLGPNNLSEIEIERIKSIINPNSVSQLPSNPFDLLPKQFESEKFNKEILEKLKDDEKKFVQTLYTEDTSAKKYNLKDKLSEEEKTKILTILSPFLPKPQAQITFSYPESMKDYNFLSSLLKKILGGDISNNTADEERLLYLKGKTFPKTKLVLYKSDEDNKKRNKMNVVSNQDGLFTPLIVNSQIPFYLQVASNKREWNYYFQGLTHSFSFFEILPPEDAIAEVRSFFTPLDLKNFNLPPSIKIPDEMTKLFPKIYYIKVISGDKLEAKPTIDGLIISLPEDTPPIQIKTTAGIKIDMQTNSSLYILN